MIAHLASSAAVAAAADVTRPSIRERTHPLDARLASSAYFPIMGWISCSQFRLTANTILRPVSRTV